MAKSEGFQNDMCVTTHTSARALVLLGHEGKLSTKELNTHLSCSYSTTRRRLLRLAELGMVTRQKEGRNHIWELSNSGDTIAEGPPDEEEFVEVITEVVAELAARVESECDTPVFSDDVVGWLEDRSLPEEVSRPEYAYRIAVYRRLLRSLLYQLHRPEYKGYLSPLTLDSAWRTQFAEALQATSDSGFETTAVDEIISPVPTWVDRVLFALHRPIKSYNDPATGLAEIYESLVSQNARRDLGQFATPKYIGQFLASWVVKSPEDTVLDPGIGAGQLASQVLKQKIRMGATEPIADITGVDIDETAVSMAAVTLKLVDGEGSAELSHTDFIEYTPRSFANDSYQTTTVDGVIANPPYSRHQAVEDEQKERFNSIIAAESGYELSSRTPLYGYFLAHATQFLDQGGRLAAIVPSKFLDTEFGRDLKRFLLQEFRIRGVIQLEDEIDVFNGIKIRPALLLLEKGNPGEETTTSILSLKQWPSKIDATELLETDSDKIPEVEESTTLSQHLLSPTERWTHYLEESDTLDQEAMTAFEEIADINRGIATGNNDYFCLTASEVSELGLSTEYLVPIIRSAHGLRLLDLKYNDWKQWLDNDRPVWLLYCYSDRDIVEKDEIEDENIVKYLNRGEEGETTDGYLVSKRNPWYRVEKQTPAPILAKYMNRTGFLFIRNHAELRCLNNLHTITPKNDYTETQIQALLAYLNSRVVNKHLSKYSMDYQGLQKVEINQLNDVPVINPLDLDDDTIQTLSKWYKRLRQVRRRKLDDEQILDEIHQVLEPILLWGDEP
ncbi:N-6 DNA methylase [Halorubrum cibi]|uniref:N-6 DNA Methylase n=1 Tax=Halorubrum cibi TaxID=413815 RepID=A0A521DED7_9EURY|nr:N-6 DNA methylase [Halorubrum cibi]SMO70013.1 N-6 DNA Methylase [Halorubrum cibi]